jgi:hypothetical protein
MRSAFLALAASAAAAAGSLYLSLGMGLKACPLCFYQRTFAFALVAVLVVGLITLRDKTPKVLLLAMPLAVGGAGVAGFHTYLVYSGGLECPDGVLGLGPAPAQSLAIFVVILVALGNGVFADVREHGVVPLLVALGLGAAAVYGSIAANPAPPTPSGPYPADQRIEMCRVPYLG